MLTTYIHRSYTLKHLHAFTCSTLIYMYNLENTSPPQLQCSNVMLITLDIICLYFFRAVTFINQLQCNYANRNPMTHLEWCWRKAGKREVRGGSYLYPP